MEIDWKKKYEDAMARMELCERTGLEKKSDYIFPELTESDDERIRKEMIEFLREAYSRGNAPEECAKWLVWLDWSKGQKPNDIRTWQKIVDKVLTDYNGIGQYLDDGICKQIAEELREKYCFDDTSSDLENVYKKGLEHGKNYGKAQAMKEQKLEWSEEDKEIFNLTIIHLLSYAYPDDPIYCEEAEKCVAWFKSLKNMGNFPKGSANSPWKPSEEQMTNLVNIRNCVAQGSGHWGEVLDSLIEDLDKLM